MPKRSSLDIKRQILSCVREKALSLAELERKINTGYRTVKSNAEELALFGNVRIEAVKHSANGRRAYMVSITAQGIRLLGGLEGKGK